MYHRSEDDENGGIYTCLKCKFLFNTPQILDVHIRLVHGKDETKKEIKKEKTY